MTGVPRFRLPLTLGPNGSVDVVEQDSDEDIDQCVRAILRHRLGDRVDLPEMGVTDPTFREAPADIDTLVEIVTRHEPRVTVSARSTIDIVETALTDIGVTWQTTQQEGRDRA